MGVQKETPTISQDVQNLSAAVTQKTRKHGTGFTKISKMKLRNMERSFILTSKVLPPNLNPPQNTK